MKQALEHNKIPTNHPKMVRETCRISLLTFAEEFESNLRLWIKHFKEFQSAFTRTRHVYSGKVILFLHFLVGLGLPQVGKHLDPLDLELEKLKEVRRPLFID